MIAEVDSPERGQHIASKWRPYRLIPSLQYILTATCAEREATLHTRVDCWRWREDVVREASVELTALGVSPPLPAIYADTDAPPAGNPSTRPELSDTFA